MPLLAREYSADGSCRLSGVSGGAPASNAGSLEISASVGEDAANRREDVRKVQDALNQVPAADGGAEPPLVTDGLCYGKTVAAIKRFQKLGCGFKWPDGVVSPNEKTHVKLKEYNNKSYAYTWAGGYTLAGPKSGGPPVSAELPYPGVRKDTIYLCPRKLNTQSPDYYTLVVVHELAHFCGPHEGTSNAIVDHSYRRRG